MSFLIRLGGVSGPRTNRKERFHKADVISMVERRQTLRNVGLLNPFSRGEGISERSAEHPFPFESEASLINFNESGKYPILARWPIITDSALSVTNRVSNRIGSSRLSKGIEPKEARFAVSAACVVRRRIIAGER